MDNSTCQLLVTADDRTGALEVGGVLANKTFSVPVHGSLNSATTALNTTAGTSTALVLDIGTRHLTPDEARKQVISASQMPSTYRCHKIDSGLRGNWPHEAHALADQGYKVAIIPSFPDAGRYCRDGVVYIQDVPVLDSPFGSDPLTAPVSSRPDEILAHTGCEHSDIEIWNAADNNELMTAILRCRQEQRLLVGPTGAIEYYARTLFANLVQQITPLELPILIACGSLNKTSREQLQQLGIPLQELDQAFHQTGPVTAIITAPYDGNVSSHDASLTAARLANRIRSLQDQFGTLLVIGGDSAAALIQNHSLETLGTIATGIPISRYQGKLLVTKGGGIGTLNTLHDLLSEWL